jgi:phosphatidate cytidylyltransferase
MADPWLAILGCVGGALIAAFLRELAVYREPGEGATRVAYAIFTVVYIGVLSSFLIQLRWLPAIDDDPNRSAHALLLTIFVPKCCDIGAYCTGMLIGRRRMTPLLSPKKTWEGAAGGLALAVITALVGASLGARPEFWTVKAAGFGVVVGIAAMLGDLAESLIKRQGQKKDASAAVPGFGGVLDVVDSVLLAAPVAYVWILNDTLTPV